MPCAWDAWLDCLSERQVAERLGLDEATTHRWLTASKAETSGNEAPPSRQHFDVWSFGADGTDSAGNLVRGALPFVTVVTNGDRFEVALPQCHQLPPPCGLRNGRLDQPPDRHLLRVGQVPTSARSDLGHHSRDVGLMPGGSLLTQ